MKKIDKKRIVNAIVDVVLIAVVFGVTDILMLDIFCTESLWAELGIYLVLYAVVFGAKSGIVHLWKKRK